MEHRYRLPQQSPHLLFLRTLQATSLLIRLPAVEMLRMQAEMEYLFMHEVSVTAPARIRRPPIQQFSGGSGTGAYVCNLTGLLGSTTYYVRAYATNSAGTAYGNQDVFATLAPVAPTLSTTAISSITYQSAVSGGNTINDGGSPITAKGVCWDTLTGRLLRKSYN